MAVFLLELEISGVTMQSIHQNSKTGGFCVGLLGGNDLEAVLVTFCGHDYSVNASDSLRQFRTSLQIKKIITKMLLM